MNPKLDKKMLKATIIIQNKLKFMNQNIKNYNEEFLKMKDRIINIIDRIQNNYDIGLINQQKYNEQIQKVDNLLLEFDSLQFPLTLRNYNYLDIKIKLYEIKQNIINLICECGTYDLLNIIKILIKDPNLIFSKSSSKYLEFLNQVFIPISSKKINSSIDLDSDKINIKNLDVVNGSLLEKIDGAIIEIPCEKCFLEISGYFKKDPLNIYKKFDILEKKIENIKLKSDNLNINITFIDLYINQMSTKDIILLTVDKIIRKLKKDHDYLHKLKSQLLSSLVKEFLMSNLQDQRKILTLFLISENDETNHLAYLLYDMISTSSDSIKPQFMAEEIFKSLHWSIQKKFKVAFKNVEKYRKKLLSLNEENISYEDRIVQMRTSDSVKAKALEKLKEINSCKDSIKAVNYLDGLLKIPFGIFKKERILTFLSDFSNNINNLIKDLIASTNNINKIDNTINEIVKNLNCIFNYYNSSSFETENKLEELIFFIERKLKKINNLINENSEYDNMIEFKENKIKTDESLEKLENLKKLNDKINNCNDEYSLQKIELEIDTNIRKELENFRNNIYGFPNSPKLVKSRKFDISYEIDDIKCDSNLKINEEFNKWKSIESQLINLLNEWAKYKHSKKEYMTKVRKTLDSCIYGQLEAKKHIERLIAQWINGKMEGNVFGFQGPPGVGKTTLCKKGLAKCLTDDNGNSRPFAFIALGGATNGSLLDGHGYTYVGSTWGRIIDILIESKCMNPVIYIDELDKVSKTEHGKEIISILTHLTDPSQNNEFTDKFFSGIKFDLSKAMIVFSYNDSTLVDSILRDRITEVKVKSISKKEKIHITKEYLLPEILEIVGYQKEDFIFTDNAINYIIEMYTYEAGVRKLKESLFELIREINLSRVLGDDIKLPFEVTEDFIKKQFYDKSKIQFTKIAKEPQIGLVNGLYATSAGTGGITIIEVMITPSDSKLSLELTGNQGNVMKESMKCAKTVAWNLLPYEIKKNIKQEWDEVGSFGLHIHCPDAAMPKDGPSAGIAITSAILSRLCNVKIRNTIAMTGEIDLNGKVHAIGGLDSKLDGAKRAGVTKVLIPKENQDDYERILNNFNENEKNNYLKDFEIIIVSHFKEVVNQVLVENNLLFNFE